MLLLIIINLLILFCINDLTYIIIKKNVKTIVSTYVLH